MKIPNRRHTRAAAIVLGGFLLAAAVWSLIPGTEHAGEAVRREAESGKIAQPSRAALSQWLQTSSDQIARRADDYELNAPRRRNELGEPEPFREQAMSAAQMEVLRTAATGQVVRLDFFPDVSRDVRVTGRWEDPDETRVLAAVLGAQERDRFSMSWMAEQTRGLLEMPSSNRAYEVLLLSDGSYVAREWLFTDVVCARPIDGGKSAEAGMPPSPFAHAAEPFSAPAAMVAVLNSRPSALATIYLDFDGEIVSGTAWNNEPGAPSVINALAARMTATQIEETWSRVASHFAVFDVNVTTDRARYDAAPANRRTHCVITPTKDARPTAGGVAYLGSFTDPSALYKVCWTFVDQVPADSALVCSHEIGHTLGLNHHGRLAGGGRPADEYYSGHGTGGTGWGPFMGAPYGKNLLQWSRGEYAFADNSLQDDLTIMTTPARIPYIADDHGNGITSATLITSGVPVPGRVERNTDGDYFQLEVGTGQQPVRLELPVGTMLDALVEVYDAQGQLLNTLNPSDLLDVNSVVNSQTRRTIFLRVAGTGKPDVLGTGYSAYSSLGAYTLTAGNPLPTKVENLAANTLSDKSIRLTWNPAVAATSYRVSRGGMVLTNLNARAFLDTGLSEQTTYSYTVTALNAAGEGEESEPASATTLSWLAANPYGLRVLTPAGAVSSVGAGQLFVFAGQMGSALTNGLFWSNSADASTGFIAPSTDWSLQIALAAGTNRLTFSAPYVEVLRTNTSASDNPNDPAYAGGWSQSSRGGFGFGAWQLAAITTNASHFRTDTWAHTNLTVESFNGFGLQAADGGQAWARRSLENPLAPGATFTWYFDNNNIDTGRSVGVAWADADGTDRFGFRAVGGQTNYSVHDGAGERDSGIPVTADGLRLRFAVTDAGGYRFEAGTQVLQGLLAAGGPVAAVVASNNSAGMGLERFFYLGRMNISAVETTNRTVVTVAPAVVTAANVPEELFDGLPVSWWLQYFGTTVGMSAAMDSDGDGFTNAQEHALGTAPTDFSSRFAVLSVSRTHTGMQITWSSVPGKSYQVQRRMQLAEGVWEPVGGAVTAAVGETAMTAVVDLEGDAAFVRVALAGD